MPHYRVYSVRPDGHYLGGTAGTPRPIIDKLSAAIGRILKSPDVMGRLSELGTTPVGSNPDELADVIRSETKKFGEALASIGVTPQ